MRFVVDAYHTLFSSGGIVRYARSMISNIAEIASDEKTILFVNRFRDRGKIWRPEKGNYKIRQFCFPHEII